jgi:hypothetical protein
MVQDKIQQSGEVVEINEIDLLLGEGELTPGKALWAAHEIGRLMQERERLATTDCKRYDAFVEWAGEAMTTLQDAIRVAPTV